MRRSTFDPSSINEEHSIGEPTNGTPLDEPGFVDEELLGSRSLKLKTGRWDRDKSVRVAVVFVSLLVGVVALAGFSRHLLGKRAKERFVTALTEGEDLLEDPHVEANEAIGKFAKARAYANLYRKTAFEDKSRDELNRAGFKALKAISHEISSLKQLARLSKEAQQGKWFSKVSDDITALRFHALLEELPTVLDSAMKLLDNEKRLVSQMELKSPEDLTRGLEEARNELGEALERIQPMVSNLHVNLYSLSDLADGRRLS